MGLAIACNKYAKKQKKKINHYLHTSSRSHVMIRCTSDVIDDVIVVEFPGKTTVVQRSVGGAGFSRLHEVVAAACQDDSEADDENEAGGNCERRQRNEQHV